MGQGKAENESKADTNGADVLMKLFCDHYRIPFNGQWVCVKCESVKSLRGTVPDEPVFLTEKEIFESQQVAGIMMLMSMG